jgi:hypothetical protein
LRQPSFLAVIFALTTSATIHAQSDSEFTYQGRLLQADQPKNGLIDVRFQAFDDGAAGSPRSGIEQFDAVPVRNGTFTVQVDFGSSVFATGDALFVEIGVREDADGDGSDPEGFTLLTPRQLISATPIALHARGVQQNAVGAAQIAAAAVGTSEVIDGSLTASDVNTTSVTTGLQRRLAAPCPSNQALRDVAASGAPACIPVVGAIATPAGSGLTSSVAGGTVTLALDADLGQRRLSGRCQRRNAAISSVNEDGSVECSYITVGASIAPRVLDAIGDVGSFLSVIRFAPNTASLPAVAYYDNTNNRLKLIDCANSTCNPVPTPIIIDDPANDVGQYVSAMSNNARAMMAYYDATADDLKFARCGDPACSTATTRVIDSVGDVGRFAEIMDAGGLAGIAYFDATNNTYKFARCNDSECSGATITTLTGLTGGGSAFSDIAASRLGLLSSALPKFVVISGGNAVVLVRCADPACVSFTTRTISTTDIAPPLAMTSIQTDGRDRHWIAHGRPGAGTGAVRHCPDPECEAVVTVSTTSLDAIPVALSLLPRQQGTPILFSSDGGSAEIGAMDFFSAEFGFTLNRLDGAASSGGPIEATITSPSIGPSLIYQDTTTDDLMFLRCARDDCADL